MSDNKLIEGIATSGSKEADGAPHLKSTDETCVVRSYAGVSKKGYAPYNPRKRNQDAILMEEDKTHSTLLFGVFDGHGEAGDLVSHYFTERVAGRLLRNAKYDKEPGGALTEELDNLEKLLLGDASIDTEFSGSTGVIGMVRGRQLTVANIGDSRVILGRAGSAAGSNAGSAGTPKGGTPSGTKSAKAGGAVGGSGSSAGAAAGGSGLRAIEVSVDHKPDRSDEKARIVSRGGRVFAVEYDDGIDGPPRVWLGHMDIPGLAMSRSLGDTVAHTAGVISEPELHSVTLTPEDRVLIWASDGLWEFMSNQEVLDFIAGVDDPRKAVDMLVAEANARWMKEEQVIDDTTVIVAFLDVPTVS